LLAIINDVDENKSDKKTGINSIPILLEKSSKVVSSKNLKKVQKLNKEGKIFIS
jgi:hypothetical protein